MASDEAKFFDEYIEAVTQWFRQTDAFEFFNGSDRPVGQARGLGDSMLKKKAFYLKFDSSLFFYELLAKTGELTLGLLVFGGDGDMSKESLGGVFGELAGIEGVGF